MTDGPYAEAKEIIANFGVIQADDYDGQGKVRRSAGDSPVCVRETL